MCPIRQRGQNIKDGHRAKRKCPTNSDNRNTDCDETEEKTAKNKHKTTYLDVYFILMLLLGTNKSKN
jgi:hypothetical protein